ncbi:MAG: hypothetical protein C4344_04635 [Acidimicrobiia bacterium]
MLGLVLAVAVARSGDDGRRLAAEGSATTVAQVSTTEAVTTTSETTTSTNPAASTTTAAATTTIQGPWIEVSVGRATAGSLTEISVTTYEPTGFRGLVTVDFGDGSTTNSYVEFYPGLKPCQGGSAFSQFLFQHAYRVPGTYSVEIALERCRSREVVKAAPVRVSVDPPADGVLPSNGPREPGVSGLSGATPEADGTVRLNVGASDRDGFIRTINVDWGDGSSPTEVSWPLRDCHDTPTSYPKDSRVATRVEHRYPTPGTFRITLTAISTGCDGESPQIARQDGEVTIP